MTRAERAAELFGQGDRLWDEGEVRKAVKRFRAAALAGSGDAQCRLGDAYDSGMGVHRNQSRAIRWYLRAVAKRNVFAAHNLAILYRNAGEPRLAAKWMKRTIR